MNFDDFFCAYLDDHDDNIPYGAIAMQDSWNAAVRNLISRVDDMKHLPPVVIIENLRKEFEPKLRRELSL